MPWFPDFVGAAELARKETRAEGRADPVGQYLMALDKGDTKALEATWPGELVVHDPRAGEVRGHRQLRRFVKKSQDLLASRNARIDTISTTTVNGRAVVELLVHLTRDGNEVAWPVAIVADAPDNRTMMFRTYASQWAIGGRRLVRPPLLEPASSGPGDVVGRHLAALDAGDADAVAGTFAPDGYLQEPVGPRIHRGRDELRSYFAARFSAGGGIALQPCAVIDDGVRCALEYNCVRWGSHDLPPQAGIGIYERGPDGLLAAARVYDDVEGPVLHAAR